MLTPANLLFLLSDNHNRALAGCYGHPQATTPNLDRIAARGVRFVNAYSASPLCCPARAALATGRFPHQTGYWDNAIVYDGRLPSWMHRLREQGHEVVSVGKLHFRSTDDDNEHGILGKCCMYEGSIGVPLLMCGPGVPKDRVVRQIAGHVDFFPTIAECVGAALAPEDEDLPGGSLWPAIEGREQARIGFAEYHAAGTRAGAFMLRERDLKLVHHVGMRPQLFDLAADPGEARDLIEHGEGAEQARALEASLRRICDPEQVDARAKADQRAKAEFWGGKDAIAKEGSLVFTPPPGHAAEIER